MSSVIPWPAEADVAVRAYLMFAIETLDALGISFYSGPNDARNITVRYLNGSVRDPERRDAADAWWAVVNERPPRISSEEALIARLALCLLLVSEDDAKNLDQHLAWFVEVLGMLGCDVPQLVQRARQYFETLRL